MATAQSTSQMAGGNGEGNHFNDVDSTTILNETYLNAVINEILTVKAKCFDLGRELGVPAHELDTLKIQYAAFNFDQAFNEVVLLWLRGRSTRTWQALVRAVDKFNNDLAVKIAGHHRAGNPPPTKPEIPPSSSNQEEDVSTSQWYMCEMPNLDEDPDDSIEGPGVAKAWAMKVHIWSRRSTLNVKFLNDIPREWGLNTQNIISWANKWKWNTHTGGFNNIPEFVENKDRGDIRVQFMTGGGCSSLIGSQAEGRPHDPTMWLNLGVGGDNYRKHLVVHEFGHALGLQHEHQRSGLWRCITKYVKIDEIMKDQEACFIRNYFAKKESKHPEEVDYSEYDPKSVMHYPLKKSWFKFKDENEIRNAAITAVDAKILLDIFGIDHYHLPTEPSEKDVEFIIKMYTDSAAAAGQIQNAPPAPQPQARRNREDEEPKIQELQKLTGNGNTVRLIDNIAAEWENVAIALEIPSAKIEEIKENQKKPSKACQQMLQIWLEEIDGCRTPISWKTLLSAIEDGTGKKGLTKKVRGCF